MWVARTKCAKILRHNAKCERTHSHTHQQRERERATEKKRQVKRENAFERMCIFRRTQ